ncbi:hypothetical protein Q604_UNBc4C00257G0001, partial [human gut metagenome]
MMVTKVNIEQWKWGFSINLSSESD